ncbi:MAG: shikimate kinase [Peptococcaceae bacterium]|nr:shikimate kinase [Peptococcaceae bacterium]
MRHIVLVGFMGTGKTAVGRRLADRLDRPFVDTDREIENLYGKTVAQICRRYGEVRFRSEETILVRKLAGRSGLVIATGGSLVLNQENVQVLRENSVFVGLAADADTVYQRIRGKRDRPFVNRGQDLKTRLQQMMAERAGAYGMAELTVDTGTMSPWEAVEKIVSYLNGAGGD